MAEPTPEEKILAACEQVSRVVGEWALAVWESFQPFVLALGKLASNPDFQAELRRLEAIRKLAQKDGGHE